MRVIEYLIVTAIVLAGAYVVGTFATKAINDGFERGIATFEVADRGKD